MCLLSLAQAGTSDNILITCQCFTHYLNSQTLVLNILERTFMLAPCNIFSDWGHIMEVGSTKVG